MPRASSAATSGPAARIRDGDRPAHPRHPVPWTRGVGVGVPHVTGRLEAEQRGIQQAAPPVGEGDRAVASDGEGQQPVVEAPGPRPHAGLGGNARTLDRLQSGEPETAERRGPKGHPHDVHLVLVGIVSRRIQALVRGGAAERLSDQRALGAGERHRARSLAVPRLPVARRPDEHVTTKPGEVGDHDRSPPTAGDGIPQHQPRCGLGGMIAGPIGIVADQRIETRAGQLGGGLRDVVQAAGHASGHGVGRAAADRIVKLRPHQRAPRIAEQRPTIAGRPGGERLGGAFEQQLGVGVTTFERRAGPVDALQRPGVPVGPAQLAADRRHAVRLHRRRAEELVESGDAHVGLGLEPREQVADPVDRGRRGVMVRAHRHRELGRGRPAGQDRPEPRPRFRQRAGVVHQARTRLVTVRRQVMQQDRAAIRSVPAVQITFLPGLATEAAPEHAVRDAEFGGERGPDGRVAEGVRRVEHVGATAKPLGVGPAEQKIANERLPGRDEFVREDIPRPDLQPAVAHEPRDARTLLRTDPEVVLEQHGLTVEEEAAKIGRGVEAVEQIVEGGNEPGHECGAGKIPLPVPVGVRDEMDGEPGHRIGSQYSER